MRKLCVATAAIGYQDKGQVEDILESLVSEEEFDPGMTVTQVYLDEDKNCTACLVCLFFLQFYMNYQLL